MNVTIVGTGKMARAIGARLLVGANGVTFLSRERDRGEALAGEVAAGAGAGAGAAGGAVGDPLAAEVIVLAVPYQAAGPVVERYADQLDGRVVVDITNPLNEDYSGLVETPAGSGAQEIAAAAHPGARVVKAYNTTFARTVADGQVAGQPLDVFVAGDDAGARDTVAQLVEAGGSRAVDAGPLARARELEALAFLHIALQGSLETGFQSAIKIVA